ncbi:MAG: chorismate mutase [bacterium]
MDKLEELRKKIDVLDTQLLQLIHERLSIVKEVGKLKKERGLKPLDPTRWNQVIEKVLQQAEQLSMRKEFVKKILDTIHEEALRIEK